MSQFVEIKMSPSSIPCQYRYAGKKNRYCCKPGFARLDGGTSRCLHHLQEQMDYIEGVSREGTKKKNG